MKPFLRGICLTTVVVVSLAGLFRHFVRPLLPDQSITVVTTDPQALLWGKTVEGGPQAADGTQVQIDFPVSQRTENVGGSDGAGLCVFSSIGHAARWQHVYQLEDFQKWMRSHPGGGYPEKVDKMIAQKCQEAGVSRPHYLQYEGRNTDLIKKALVTSRMPSITYAGHDCHYSGRIAHMVNTILWTDRYAVILDNNFIKEDQLVWMTPAEAEQRWAEDGGWVVVLLGNPPPPPPHN
jgi:hypothetical protein